MSQRGHCRRARDFEERAFGARQVSSEVGRGPDVVLDRGTFHSGCQRLFEVRARFGKVFSCERTRFGEMRQCFSTGGPGGRAPYPRNAMTMQIAARRENLMDAVVVRVVDGVHGVHAVDHGVNHSADHGADLAVCQADLVAADFRADLVGPALGLWGLLVRWVRWVQERAGPREEAE